MQSFQLARARSMAVPWIRRSSVDIDYKTWSACSIPGTMETSIEYRSLFSILLDLDLTSSWRLRNTVSTLPSWDTHRY
jgi:hypothetical protein